MAENNSKIRERAAEEKRQWVRITKACNNDCLFCLDQEAQNGEIIPMAEVLQVLQQGRKESATRAIISGGEPTLHPQVFEIIRKAKQLGYRHIQMISNGRMLAYENFVKRLKEAGLDEVTLSLHSHKKNDFEKMSGVKGSYLQAMQGLRNALDNNFIVSVDIVMNKINHKTLKETILFFEKMGVSEFDLLHLIPFGSAWKNKDQLFFSPAEAKKYLHRAFQLGKRKDLFIWTNRLPAAYLEGFEELIQHPIKISGEIRGMERKFLEFVEGGKKMSCFGERCDFCFLHDFCADLAELRDKKFLEAKPRPFCLAQKKARKKVFRFGKNFDIYEFLEFFIDHRYFVKSSSCSDCKYDQLCQGAQINEIRSKGFKILQPVKISKAMPEKKLLGKEERINSAIYRFSDPCDHKCVFCRKRKGVVSKKSEATIRKAEQDFSRLKKEGIGKIILGGKEPFNNPNIFEIIKKAKKSFSVVEAQTSSMKLANKIFLKKLSRCKMDNIQIPVYGASAATYDKIVGHKGSFTNILKALDLSNELSLSLIIRVVIMRQNIAEVPKIVELLRKKYPNINIQLAPIWPTLKSRMPYAKLVANFSEIEKILEMVFKNIKGKIFLEDIPFCIIKKAQDKQEKKIDKNIFFSYNDNNKQFFGHFSPEKCQDCAYKGKCQGISAQYADLYGYRELKTIKV